MKNTNKKMTAKFPGYCAICSERFPVGAEIVYRPRLVPAARTAHVDCARLEVLDTLIFNYGIKSMQDDFNETHWLSVAAKYEAEKAAILAKRAA